jgi:NADH-quinone oxidoreductase subunit J
MPDLLFNVLAVFIVACAAGVVFNRNTVASALCLLLSLVGVAGLFVQLDAFLLAALLVFVYAGAVVALFLFIIMLLDMQGGDRKPFTGPTVAAGTLAGLLLAGGVISFAAQERLQARAAPLSSADATLMGQTGYYGELLFTRYLLPVEVVGFLLLIAMLGVIVISRKFEEDPGAGSQEPKAPPTISPHP